MKPDRTDLARHVPVRPPVHTHSSDGVAAATAGTDPRTSGKGGSAHRTSGRRTTLTTNRRRRTPWCTSHRTAPTAWITGHSGATPVARHRPPRTCGTGTAPDALGRGPPAPARRRDTTMGHQEDHAITCSPRRPGTESVTTHTTATEAACVEGGERTTRHLPRRGLSDPSGILLLMPHDSALDLVQIADPREVTPELRRELIDCWITVTNTGGAAGFPFPPVGDDDVTPSRTNSSTASTRTGADSLSPGPTDSSPDGSSSTAILTGSSDTGARSTICRPAPPSADAASDPPSSTSSGGSPAMSWASNSCTSQPGEARGSRTSTDGSDGARSVAGPQPSDSHPTTPVTRS